MLFAGPVLFIALSRARRLAHFIDRFLVAGLVLLVLLLLVPHTVEALGWFAFVYLLLGYAFPGLLERAVRRAAETMHLATLVLALAGLLLHALLDGAGLAENGQVSGDVLGAAIILHRFGVGLMLWLIMQPAFGSWAAWLMLSCMALATVAGYYGSSLLLPLADERAILALQAVITGTIMHSLVHRGHMSADASGSNAGVHRH